MLQLRKTQKSYTTNTKRVVTINLWKPRIWKYAYNYQVIHKHTIIILKCTPIHIYVHTYTYSIMHTWINNYIWIRYGYSWFCHHNLFCVQERQNKKHTHTHLDQKNSKLGEAKSLWCLLLTVLGSNPSWKKFYKKHCSIMISHILKNCMSCSLF